MSVRSKGFVVVCCLALRSLVACGSNSAPPPGSCAGGPATGFFAAACNECGQQKCDAELRDKAGSGYAQGYWGGDGACAAFNECTCKCKGSTTDPLTCATMECIAELTPACQAAVQKATDCIDQKCATECRP